jgi:hypothetical protein
MARQDPGSLRNTKAISAFDHISFCDGYICDVSFDEYVNIVVISIDLIFNILISNRTII